MDIEFLVQKLCALLLAASLLTVLLGAGSALWNVVRRRRIQAKLPDVAGPPVSILKPLKGCDADLEGNLLSIIQQDYPEFEVIFAVEDPTDPAAQVVRSLIARFPSHPLRLVVGGASDGLNPKVKLLRSMCEVARYDWILVSDSNICAEPDYLRKMSAVSQEEGASLVHSVLAGVRAEGWGAHLENAHMNSWVLASIAFADRFGHPCVIGKSMLLRRSRLRELGGWQSVRDILAEDYVVGHRYDLAGDKVALCPFPLRVIGGHRKLGDFWNRHQRWGQMRRRISPGFYLAEVLWNPLPFLLLALVTGVMAPSTALALYLLRWGLDSLLAFSTVLPKSRLPLMTWLMLPVRDLLLPMLWLLGGLRTTIVWRGHRFRIGPGSQLFPLESEIDFEQHGISA